MKCLIILTGGLCALAAPAAAEFGRGPAPSPAGFQAPKTVAGGAARAGSPYASPYVPTYKSPYASSNEAGSSYARPKSYAAPSPVETFKPFEGYKSRPGKSLFGPDTTTRRP